MVSCSMKSIKYSLYVFNVLLTISGLGIIITGAVVLSNLYEFKYFLEGKPITASIALILVGVVIFGFAFVGCYGAVKERYNLLVTFAVAVLVIFFVQIILGIIVMIFRNDFSTDMEKSLQDSMRKYADSEIDHKSWDAVQTKFMCCGIKSATEWHDTDSSSFGRYLPRSCCINQNADCANGPSEAYQDGCFSKLEAKVRSNSKLLIGVIIGITIIEIVGMILAGFLSLKLRREAQRK
ncbi:hypothetical protein QAD02_022211 [Eretmocerus hayati]|uniref:Uncharacterized protein n=1 Tax=Eretmocerus hayati TaxID=131215 RepID=A0ACC2PSM8_9HYME|nr:hypothetical protein QAD02_022211 [Eretmocerus hayati]